MTSIGAITAGLTEAVQDFHPRVAHLHTFLDWLHCPRSHTPSPLQHFPTQLQRRGPTTDRPTWKPRPHHRFPACRRNHGQPAPPARSRTARDGRCPLQGTALRQSGPPLHEKNPKPTPPRKHGRSPHRIYRDV
ncbi:hypothetical protein D1007_49146 [Hordeum vulgare]|nr:hypothetical protein D1007_49146 [Hordeum vulgare]